MSPNDKAENEKMEEESINKENGASVKSEIREDIKDEQSPLWEGEVRFKTQEKSKEIKASVKIFHKDDSKNGSRQFDWPPHGNKIIFFGFRI